MINIKVALGQILKDRLNAYPEHAKFKWYSYSDYKARFYVYVSVPLIYAFLLLKVKPNTITLIYIFLGLFAGCCLAVNDSVYIYAAIIIFFLRSIFDWCDGAVAKYTNQVSSVGHCLDVYGAYSGWIALWTGLGIYAYHKTGYNFLIYTFPLAPLLFAIDIKSFSANILGGEEKSGEAVDAQGVDFEENAHAAEVPRQSGIISRVMNFIALIFFDHRARTVDAICLLILIELNSKLSVMWIYYLAFIAFHFIYFLINIAYFLRRR